jgi:hypothetical protein
VSGPLSRAVAELSPFGKSRCPKFAISGESNIGGGDVNRGPRILAGRVISPKT